MSSTVKTIISIIFTIVLSTSVVSLIIYAGSLSPSSTPTDTMKTLDDIYHKLTSGSGGAFDLNPSASPTSTMHSLQEIYDASPDFASSPGDATSSDICNSKTFYINSSTRYTGSRTACQNCVAGSIAVGEMTCGKTTDIDCDGELETGTESTPCLTECSSTCTAYASCTTGSCDGANNCSNSQICQDGSGCTSGYPSACHICSSGSIVNSPDTNWGAGSYDCSGSNKRCSSGSCITCGGWMNGGYCWYNIATGSCTTACSGHGGVYGDTCDWVNDPADCSTCKHFYTSASMCTTWTRGPGLPNGNIYECAYHIDGNNDCGTSGYRQCACNL